MVHFAFGFDVVLILGLCACMWFVVILNNSCCCFLYEPCFLAVLILTGTYLALLLWPLEFISDTVEYNFF